MDRFFQWGLPIWSLFQNGRQNLRMAGRRAVVMMILPVFIKHQDYSSSACHFEILPDFLKFCLPFWESDQMQCRWWWKSNINTKALLPAILRFCLLFSESDSGHQKLPTLGLKNYGMVPTKIFVAPAHIINVFFAKKTDPDWSTLALGRLSIKFRSV